jgi:hypothetical protein
MKRLLILPTIVKNLAAGTSLPAVADVTGQTLTPSNYVGFPPAGTDAMTYLLVGKAQVQQSQEVVLVDLLTRPWPVLQRSVNGSPLAAHDATHGVQTVVPPDGLKGLVGFYLDGALVANGSGADFDAAKFDVTDNGDGTVSITLTPSATPIVGNDSIWQALGDLAAAIGPNAAVRVPVGANGEILTADSTQTAGMRWVAPAAGAAFGTITGPTAIAQSALDGASGDVADAAHRHAFAAPGAGYPVDVAAAEADGVATTPARSDHVHAHGSGYLPDAHHARSHDHATAGDGTALAPVSLAVSAGPVAFQGDLTPAQITADQNNYNPTGLAAAYVLRLSSDATRTITGLAGGADGRELILVNVGSQNIVLADEHASSTAANRFALDTSLTLGADTAARLLYDSTSTRWRLTGIGKATGGGSGNVATDTIWVAKGDLAVATGTGAAARLAVGANGKALKANSGTSTGAEWGNLTQSVSHDTPDTDSTTSALHHTLGTGANQAAAGNDSRLSDSRAPTTHGAAAHTGDVLPADNQALGAFYLDVDEIAAPSNPSSGTRRLFVNTATGKLSVRTSGGSSVSLEEQAAAGGLIIQELDGSPTGTFTTLKLPNGTVTDNGDGSATYTPAGGGGLTHTYVGYNTIGASTLNMGIGTVYLKKITLAAAGFLASISAYVKETGDNILSVAAAVYDDTGGGAPSVQHVIGASTTGIPSGGNQVWSTGSVFAQRWFHMPIGVYLPAGDYWLAVQAVAINAGNIQIAYDTGGSDYSYVPGGVWFADGTRYTPTADSRHYSIRGDLLQ